ncbi:MAG: ATP-binding protein [Gammaproteobacteria bacterium]
MNVPYPLRRTPSSKGVKIPIRAVADIVIARQHGREEASKCGFSNTDSTLITTIISELARNILLYADEGEIILEYGSENGRCGIIVTSKDNGPGIVELERALMGGYSTSGGLGLGLSGIKQMTDEFSVESGKGNGTILIAKKWLP